MGEVKIKRTGYRSLFWPIVLIAIGVIWLLVNLGVISGLNIAVLFRLWPLILIAVGLDLLFGRESRLTSAILGVGTVAVIIVLMLIGPSIGLAPNLDITVDEYSVPREDATSARIDLHTSVGEVNIFALADSGNLFEAEVAHVGELNFVSEGTTEKHISLSQREENFSFGLDFLGRAFNPENELYWRVGLSNALPIRLAVDNGLSNATLDLSDIQLTGLEMNGGVGSVELRLPAMEDSYEVSVNGGVGNTTILVPENAAVALDIDGGVGEVRIDVPDDAGVRVAGESGVGGINVPAYFNRIEGDDSDFVGADGVWETEGYASAERKITITYNGGVGSLNID